MLACSEGAALDRWKFDHLGWHAVVPQAGCRTFYLDALNSHLLFFLSPFTPSSTKCKVNVKCQACTGLAV